MAISDGAYKKMLWAYGLHLGLRQPFNNKVFPDGKIHQGIFIKI